MIVAIRSHRDSEYYGTIGKQNKLTLARKKYAKSIMPAGLDASYLELDLSANDSNKLGAGSYINFMFAIEGTYHEPIILFPESTYGVHKKYFLLNVEFRPNYRTVENGRLSGQHGSVDYHYLTGNYGAHMSPQTYHSTTVRQEIPSSALLTFKPVDKEYTIIVVDNNVTQKNYDFVKQHFELTDINREAIRKGQRYLSEIAPDEPGYQPVSLPLLTGGTPESIGNVLGVDQPITYMFVNTQTKEIMFPSVLRHAKFYLCSKVIKQPNGAYAMMVDVISKSITGSAFMGVTNCDQSVAQDILNWSIPLNRLEDFIPRKNVSSTIKNYYSDWQDFLTQYRKKEQQE